MKKQIVFLWIVFCFLLPAVAFAQPDRISEVESLLAGLNSPSSVRRVNAAKIITRSGLTEERLYAKVALLLKEGYAAGTSANHIDEMAWLCKALAASGNVKYRPLLEEVAANTSSDKLRHYAEQSDALIEEYAQRRRILNATESWDESLTAEENRLINMLQSDNNNLKRDAAKMIVRKVDTDPKVFEVAAETLIKMVNDFQSDSLYIDTMAWLCKALAASGNSRYVETLKQVEAATDNQKLKNYANKALNSL